MIPNKFVISRRIAGFGDLLISLCSAWQYAKRTNRVLVIDWRQSHYLKDKTRNAFPAFFEPVSEIDGVPVISDDTVSSLKFPTPAYFALERLGKLNPLIVKYSYSRLLKKIPRVVAYRTSILNQVQRDEIGLVTSGEDVPEPTVIFLKYLPTELSNTEACRTLLDHIKPRKEILQKIDSFADTYFRGKKVISVHVRHPNGTNIGYPLLRYWENESLALINVCRAIGRIKDKLGDDCIIFVCTDNGRIQEVLNGSLDKVITREKYFPPDNLGELLMDASSIGRNKTNWGQDALIEMFLLARGDGLVCYPPESCFSFYARYCRNGPNLRETETLKIR
jgi:hypothetical protein